MKNQAKIIPRKRRPRTSAQQLEILQEAFCLEPMPCANYRELLSKQVNLSSRSIQIWFQNKRQKLKLPENKAAREHFESKKENAAKVLSRFLSNNRSANDEQLLELSTATDISTESIRLWFQSREMKMKLDQQLSCHYNQKTSPVMDEFIQQNAKRVNESMYSKNGFVASISPGSKSNQLQVDTNQSNSVVNREVSCKSEDIVSCGSEAASSGPLSGGDNFSFVQYPILNQQDCRLSNVNNNQMNGLERNQVNELNAFGFKQQAFFDYDKTQNSKGSFLPGNVIQDSGLNAQALQMNELYAKLLDTVQPNFKLLDEYPTPNATPNMTPTMQFTVAPCTIPSFPDLGLDSFDQVLNASNFDREAYSPGEFFSEFKF